MEKRLSGAQRGDENASRFERYLDSLKAEGKQLPLKKDGQINLSKVALDSGIGDRGRLYTNERIRTLLDGATNALHSSLPANSEVIPVQERSPSNKQAKLLERRVNKLEQQNAALVAENAELRRQLKALRLQMGREDMSIETGRRIPSAPHA
jgi:hypothetical protein